MPPLTPMSRSSMPPPPPAGGAPAMGKRETEIVVMPEKYYGMALKMEGKTQAELEAMALKKPVPPPVPKPPVPSGPIRRRPIWPFILLIVALFAVIAGLFVWFNREALFPQPKPPVIVETPPVKLAPNAPANVVATVTSGTAPVVSLSWVDAGGEKTGFRIERREAGGTYLPLTPLPPSATTFLDVTVRSLRTYQYRVFAIGPGGESASSNEATARLEDSLPPPPVVPTLPPGGLDSDSDGLSDVEEAVFGTDAHAPDTDSDGFLDGNEVFNLYNPAAKAPVRLLDSGLVTAFVSPAGWSMYVPKGWTSALDSADGSSATIRTGQGEVFRVSIQGNPNNATLSDWYVSGHAGVTATQLREILTKGGLTGLLGPERTDAQFGWDGKVFVLQYDLGTKTFINFRTSYEMMLNSLRLSGAPVLPESSALVPEGPGQFLQTTTSAVTTTQ